MAKGILTDIVPVARSDVYPRIETRNGGPLSSASEGKTLLITGASKGIGRVCVDLYHSPWFYLSVILTLPQSIAIFHAHTHPKSIIITARSTGPLDAVAAELAAIDSNIKVVKASLDVGDADAVGVFFKNLRDIEGVGKIDVLFNNAGCLEVRYL